MSPSRRPAAPLLVTAVVAFAAACAGPSPGPSGATATAGTSAPPSTPASTASTASTASPATGERYPVLIVRAEDAGTTRWYVTAPDDPARRRALIVSPEVVAVGPAGADGALVLGSPTQLLFATLGGGAAIGELTVVRAIDLRGRGVAPGSPACVGPNGRVAMADLETLALTVVSPTRAAVAVAVPDALGECAWLDDGRLLVDREGDRLVAVDPATGLGRPVDGGGGRHPCTGGGLLSLVDRSGRARVVVRAGELGDAAEPALGPILFVVGTAVNELISRATLSPDGGWLAVEVTVDPESAAVRWLRLYRVGAAGAEFVGAIRLDAGEQVTLMPAP